MIRSSNRIAVRAPDVAVLMQDCRVLGNAHRGRQRTVGGSGSVNPEVNPEVPSSPHLSEA